MQTRPRLAHETVHLRIDHRAYEMGIRVVILFRQISSDHGQVRFRLTWGNARLQSTNYVEEVCSALSCDRFIVGRVGVIADRNPQLRRRGLDGKLEALRHYSNHREALSIKVDGASHNIAGRSKSRLPQIVAEHYRFDPRLLVIGIEVTSQRGAYAENPKKIRGHDMSFQVSWLPASR